VNRGHDILLQTTVAEVERSAMAAAQAGSIRLTPCREPGALEARLADRPASIVVVDVDPQPRVALAQVAALAARFPRSRFVPLCSVLSSELLLDAMAAGARHCLVKSSLATELPEVLRRLLKEFEPAASSGRVVTVLSTAGGCGATTIAINLGEELRRQDGDSVLLVDLDAHYGALAGFLGLNARFGAADVLSHPGAIDDQLVSSTAVAHADGLQALLGPACVDFSHPRAMDWNRIDDMLAACRQAAAFTVVDAPRIPHDAAAQLALGSVLTLVVFELSVTGVRCTRALLGALAERSVPAGSLLPVANRWQKRGSMLELDVAREALGGIEVARVANDFAGAIRAINLGQTVAQVAPRSPMRTDIQSLASRVHVPVDANDQQRRTVA
jgi:pilus assembly protein CpaE